MAEELVRSKLANGSEAVIGKMRTNARLISSIVLGLAWFSLGAPTFYRLSEQVWSRGDGAHGPFILFLVAWLIWRKRNLLEDVEARKGGLALFPVSLGLGFYFVGRSVDVLVVEVFGLYITVISVVWLKWGTLGLRQLWFPLVFAAFLIPVPEDAIAGLTLPFKLWLSSATVSLLYQIGYPVALSGVSIYIAQYELLVENACAGLNSMVGLISVGAIYCHLAQVGWRRSVLLCLATLPVAIAANFLRVLILVLLTYHFGDRVGQSFAHDLAGVMMYFFALCAIFLLDRALEWVGEFRKGHPGGRGIHSTNVPEI